MSAHGFSVNYPATWYPLSSENGKLDILSDRRRVKAVVIAEGEAEIMVSEEQVVQTIDQAISYYVGNTKVVSDTKELSNVKKWNCSDPRVIVSKDEVAPNYYAIYTMFFCQKINNVFSIILKNWEGDTRQAEYRNTALQIARSIKLIRQ